MPPQIDLDRLPYGLVERLARSAGEAAWVPRPSDHHQRPPLLVEHWRVDVIRDHLRELTGAGVGPAPLGGRAVCVIPVCVERDDARWIAWTELGWISFGAHAWLDGAHTERRLLELEAWCDALRVTLHRVRL